MKKPLSRPEDFPVQLRVLGPFDLRVHGQPVRMHVNKARAVLAYLAVRIDVDVPRTTIGTLLWSERAPDQSRASLRQALSVIRKALGTASDAALSGLPGSVRLNSEFVWVDHHAISTAKQQAPPDELAVLADLYKADFLEGMDLQEPEFDIWLTSERAIVRAKITGILETLAEHLENDGRHDDAQRRIGELLTLDPLNEAAHRNMMRLYSVQGRYDAALRQFEMCRE